MRTLSPGGPLELPTALWWLSSGAYSFSAPIAVCCTAIYAAADGGVLLLLVLVLVLILASVSGRRACVRRDGHMHSEDQACQGSRSGVGGGGARGESGPQGSRREEGHKG